MSKRILVFVVDVLLSLIFSGNTFAQSQIGLNGIGIKLGFVDPEGVDSVIGLGALVDLGMITPSIMLEGNVDYWSKSEGTSSATSIKVSFRDLIIGGTAKYMFKSSNPKFRPFASGGLAFHLFKAAVESSSPFFVNSDNSETKLGIHLGGGLFYNLSPQLDLLADGRYTIVSDASQIAIQAGIVYKLKKQ
jgi:opacity protein-like surface antigen